MRAAAHLTMGQQTGAGEGGVGPWVRAASLALLTACYSLGELGHFLIATTSKQVANTVLYCTVLYCTVLYMCRWPTASSSGTCAATRTTGRTQRPRTAPTSPPR